MAKAYTQEFLVAAFLSRYKTLGTDKVANLKVLAESHYAKVGKDVFRTSASLDAAALKKYSADYTASLNTECSAAW